MASLMTIPRELRDHICHFALLAQTNEAPSLNKPFEELVANRKQYENPNLISWSSLVLSDPSHNVSNATALLLVNRQLRAESQEAIQRLEKQGVTYELDVVVVDEILPLTTWICVPFLTTAVEELNITIRISGSYDPEKDRIHDGFERLFGPYSPYGSFKGFQEEDVDGPALGWQIYGILERFLRVGATHERTNGKEHRHIILKTLTIDVQTPPGVDPELFGHPKSCTRGDCGSEKTTVLHPDFLGNVIWRRIKRNLKCRNLNPRGSFDQCQIVFEHMEHITVTKDGDVKEAFDVAELVKDLSAFRAYYTPARDIHEYKNKLLRMRRDRGLRVLVNMCPRCDCWNCWYFRNGEPCTNPLDEAHGKRFEEIEDMSDEYEEEALIVGPEIEWS
jgi:hypothetical protein